MKKGVYRYINSFVRISATLLTLALISGLSAPYINPVDFWPVAFFGLAFPLIWFFHLLFTLFLIRQKKWFYTFLFFLLVATPMLLKHFTLPLSQNKSKLSDYTILTYNVHGFSGIREGKSDYERQAGVHDFVNEVKPDIVCMQEYAMKSAKHARYMDYLNNGLNLPNKVLSDFDPDEKGTSYCLLIASNFPIIQQGSVFTIESQVYGIFADIQFPEGIVRVYNIHLESVKLIGEKKLLVPHKNLNAIRDVITYARGTIRKLKKAYLERIYQTSMVAESIRQSPYPVIVAGDFNDTPASRTYRVLNKGLRDAALYKGFGLQSTYAESLYPIRIDQVFIDRRLYAGQYQIKKIYLSDHYPVIAGFGFN